jgi:hypothetical protein
VKIEVERNVPRPSCPLSPLPHENRTRLTARGTDIDGCITRSLLWERLQQACSCSCTARPPRNGSSLGFVSLIPLNVLVWVTTGIHGASRGVRRPFANARKFLHCVQPLLHCARRPGRGKTEAQCIWTVFHGHYFLRSLTPHRFSYRWHAASPKQITLFTQPCSALVSWSMNHSEPPLIRRAISIEFGLTYDPTNKTSVKTLIKISRCAPFWRSESETASMALQNCGTATPQSQSCCAAPTSGTYHATLALLRSLELHTTHLHNVASCAESRDEAAQPVRGLNIHDHNHQHEAHMHPGFHGSSEQFSGVCSAHPSCAHACPSHLNFRVSLPCRLLQTSIQSSFSLRCSNPHPAYASGLLYERQKSRKL